MTVRETIAVVGGDRRMARLAELLRGDGFTVVTWGLEQADAPNGVPLDRALGAGVVILPAPAARGKDLNAPLTDAALPLDRLWPRLAPDRLLLGGMVGDLAERVRETYGLTLLDYCDREEVRLLNAIPTAEGAVALAMDASERTVWESRCLIVGAGRVGTALAVRLRALGAETDVSVRRREDMARVRAMGCRAAETGALPDLGRYDFIFNTVPSPVLTAEALARVRRDCPLLELASRPGGIDEGAARTLGLTYIAAPGLPGRAAPLTAAAILRDSVRRILEERGEPV